MPRTFVLPPLEKLYFLQKEVCYPATFLSVSVTHVFSPGISRLLCSLGRDDPGRVYWREGSRGREGRFTGQLILQHCGMLCHSCSNRMCPPWIPRERQPAWQSCPRVTEWILEHDRKIIQTKGRKCLRIQNPKNNGGSFPVRTWIEMLRDLHRCPQIKSTSFSHGCHFSISSCFAQYKILHLTFSL